MDLRWWWVRHAPVVGHRGELNGQRDVPCDTSDSRAFAALAAVLPADAVWVTSHLSRARDTAAAILSARAGESSCGGTPIDVTRASYDAPLSGRAVMAPGGAVPAPPIIEPDFSEQSFGDWAGYTWEEIALRDPAESRRFWTDPVGLAPPAAKASPP